MGMPIELKKHTGLLDTSRAYEKLKPWHKQAIILHLEGWNAVDIGDSLQKSPTTVRTLLKSDSAKELISDYYSYLDSEYQSLYKMAVNAMRDAMSPSAPLELRVNTAKFFLQGKTKPHGDNGDTEDSAEGMVQKVVNLYVDQRSNSDAQEDFNKKLVPFNTESEED